MGTRVAVGADLHRNLRHPHRVARATTSGHGGIEKTASSARSAGSASTSPSPTRRRRPRRSPADRGERPSVTCWLGRARALRSLPRTLQARLLDATEVSSDSDTSVPRSRARRAGSAPRAGSPRDAAAPRRRRARRPRALLVTRVGRGIAVRDGERIVRIGLDPDGLSERRAGRRSGRPAGRVLGRDAAARPPARRGRRWSRSGTATCAPSSCREPAARATRAGTSPGARPRRRERAEHAVTVRGRSPRYASTICGERVLSPARGAAGRPSASGAAVSKCAPCSSR